MKQSIKKLSLYLGIFAATLFSAVSFAEDIDLSEAEVTIIQDNKGQRVEEHRIGGQLYLVKVVPAVGPAYVLIDHNGDGQFELTNDDPTANLPTAKWPLFKWK